MIWQFFLIKKILKNTALLFVFLFITFVLFDLGLQPSNHEVFFSSSRMATICHSAFSFFPVLLSFAFLCALLITYTSLSISKQWLAFSLFGLSRLRLFLPFLFCAMCLCLCLFVSQKILWPPIKIWQEEVTSSSKPSLLVIPLKKHGTLLYQKIQKDHLEEGIVLQNSKVWHFAKFYPKTKKAVQCTLLEKTEQGIHQKGAFAQIVLPWMPNDLFFFSSTQKLRLHYQDPLQEHHEITMIALPLLLCLGYFFFPVLQASSLHWILSLFVFGFWISIKEALLILAKNHLLSSFWVNEGFFLLSALSMILIAFLRFSFAKKS